MSNHRFSAQVAELVDALVSGTSGESRGGSSPLLGTISPFEMSRQPSKIPEIQLFRAKSLSQALARLRQEPTEPSAVRQPADAPPGRFASRVNQFDRAIPRRSPRSPARLSHQQVSRRLSGHEPRGVSTRNGAGDRHAISGAVLKITLPQVMPFS